MGRLHWVGSLSSAIDADRDEATQRELVEGYRRVLGTGRKVGRGFDAGITWHGFRDLPGESPPQVVGHTRQDHPVQKDNVVCENPVRVNVANPDGEAVVESSDSLVSHEPTDDGGVHAHGFRMPTGAPVND